MPKPSRDRLVGRALRHQQQHVALARRKLDVVGFDHSRQLARYQRHGRLFVRRREANAGDRAEQRCQPVGQRRIRDVDREHDGGRLPVHASALSATVSLTWTGSPARRMVMSTTEPTLSGPSARSSARTPASFSLFQATRMSP
jgi:hypothetical protein